MSDVLTRPVLQSRLPYEVPARMPGMAPLAPADWLLVDDAFGAQMALRDILLATRPGAVLALQHRARPAAEELLETVMRQLGQDARYRVSGAEVRRPDGVTVPLDRTRPLATLGRLVQQDFCLLQKAEGEAEHVLTGAVLCFPAQWTLAEKLGRPLLSIHLPVPDYTEDLARRVQRLFDGLKPDRPIWRANWLRCANPALFTPMSESLSRDDRHPRLGDYVRSERQSLWRLPESGAVAFGIHTFMVRAPVEAQDRPA